METIQVLLIRHPETVENYQIQECYEVFSQLYYERTLPNWKKLFRCFQNYNFLQTKASRNQLSSLGKRQLEDMKMTLLSVEFWDSYNFEVCGYNGDSLGSSLGRNSKYEQTYSALFPTEYHDKCIPLTCMTDTTLRNLLLQENFIDRVYQFVFSWFSAPLQTSVRVQKQIRELENWIIEQHEQKGVKQVILIGQGNYFQLLCKDNFVMLNGDIWQTTFTYQRKSSSKDLTRHISYPLLNSTATGTVAEDESYEQHETHKNTQEAEGEEEDRVADRIGLSADSWPTTHSTLSMDHNSTRHNNECLLNVFETKDAEQEGVWSHPTILLRTPLAMPYAMDTLYSVEIWKQIYQTIQQKNAAAAAHTASSSATAATSSTSNHTSSGDNSSSQEKKSNSTKSTEMNEQEEETEEEDEPICRICQAKQSEAPTKRLIRPCHCAGSSAYVHCDCLNQWRATSSEAYTRCGVCRLEYITKTSLLSQCLLHPFFILLLTILLVQILVWSVGYTLHYLEASEIVTVSIPTMLLEPHMMGLDTCRRIGQISIWQYLRVHWLHINLDFFFDIALIVFQKVLCTPVAYSFLNATIWGYAILGSFSHAYQYLQLFRHLQQRLLQQHGQAIPPQNGLIGIFSLWISTGNLMMTYRIFVLVGIAMMYIHAYTTISAKGRYWSQSMNGNDILEPPQRR